MSLNLKGQWCHLSQWAIFQNKLGTYQNVYNHMSYLLPIIWNIRKPWSCKRIEDKPFQYKLGSLSDRQMAEQLSLGQAQTSINI